MKPQFKEKTVNVSGFELLDGGSLKIQHNRIGSKRLVTDYYDPYLLDNWIQQRFHSGGVVLFENPDIFAWLRCTDKDLVMLYLEDFLTDTLPVDVEAAFMEAFYPDVKDWEVLTSPWGDNLYAHCQSLTIPTVHALRAGQ